MGVSVFSDRSGVVPSGTIWGSSPTVGKRTVFLYGTMALIGPDADGTDVSVFSDRSGNAPHGAMWASPPTLKTHVFRRGRCLHRPGGATVWACPFFLTAPETHPSGRCGHRPLLLFARIYSASTWILAASSKASRAILLLSSSRTWPEILLGSQLAWSRLSPA